MFLRQVMARDIVANKDVAFVILQKKIQSAKTPEEKGRYEKERFDLMQVIYNWLNDCINYAIILQHRNNII